MLWELWEFEAIRILKLQKTKYYQASTSEIFGNTYIPQNEKTPFRPEMIRYFQIICVLDNGK